jgi:predicted phage terminase large subunit-like protein
MMTMLLRTELIQNQKILDHYGELIDYETHKQSRLQKQTQNIINLKIRKEGSYSLQGVSTGQGIRGTSGIAYCFIDDPIDLEKVDEYEKATQKFIDWFKYKVLPFCRGGKVWLIGTRYGVRDLYKILSEEKLYYEIERTAVEKILPYTVDYPTEGPISATNMMVHDESEWRLLAPELWEHAYNGSMVQNIVFEMHKFGERVTQQELMNNPLPINPLIKWEWMNHYQVLPAHGESMTWMVFVDVATGESKTADYTAFTLCGEYESNFYIYDIDWGRWTGKQKQDRLEAFVINAGNMLDVNTKTIKLGIETIFSQRDFFQRIRDESWLIPKAISPQKRKDKITRITHGLSQEMENSKVYLFANCRHIPQLKQEVTGFPNISSDHIIDSLDQNIHYLKTSRHGVPISGRTSRKFQTSKSL